MNVVVPGQIFSIGTLRDGTVKVVIHLQEVSPESISSLYQMTNCLVKTYITTENIAQEAKDAVDQFEMETEGKSPSKRMRNVLYRLWEQDNQGYEDFELWYKWHMNRLIESLKSKLI